MVFFLVVLEFIWSSGPVEMLCLELCWFAHVYTWHVCVCVVWVHVWLFLRRLTHWNESTMAQGDFYKRFHTCIVHLESSWMKHSIWTVMLMQFLFPICLRLTEWRKRACINWSWFYAALLHIHLQVLIILWLLKYNAEFKQHNHCHTECNWDNQLDDLFGTITECLLKVHVT